MAVLIHHKDTLQVAQKVLSGSGVTPPEHLLDGLSDILDERPNDVLFKLMPEPGKGFGKIQCLEKDCLARKKVISLNDSARLDDGGKAIGIGSLDLFVHHQKESPAHKRAIAARLKESAGTSSNPSSSSASASNLKKEKKRVLVEISDDDDIIVVPKKSKNGLSSSQGSSSSSSSQKGKTILAPVFNQDKGKGRAPLEKTSSLSSIGANNKSSTANNISHQILMDASRKDNFSTARSGGLSSDGDDVDMSTGRDNNRESSADSDLVDLSSRFKINSSSSSAGTANPGMVKSEPGRRLSISAIQPSTSTSAASNSQIRQRTISNESIKSSTSEKDKKVGIKSAYDQFKALQAGKNGSTSVNNASYRDVKPLDGLASSSSSSPVIGKKEAGLDSGYLSSINTSSSSPLRNDNTTKILAPGVIEGPVSYMVTLKNGSNVTIPKGSIPDASTGCYTAKQLAGLSEEQKNQLERYEEQMSDRRRLLRVYMMDIERQRSRGNSDANYAKDIQSYAEEYRETELAIKQAKDEITKIINNPRGTGASTSTTTATPAASISAAQAGSSSASQSKTTKPPLSQNALLQIRGYEYNIGFKQDVIQQLQDAMKSLDRFSMAYQDKLARLQQEHATIASLQASIKKIKDEHDCPAVLPSAASADHNRVADIANTEKKIAALAAEISGLKIRRRSMGRMYARKMQQDIDNKTLEKAKLENLLNVLKKGLPTTSSSAGPSGTSTTPPASTATAAPASAESTYQTQLSKYHVDLKAFDAKTEQLSRLYNLRMKDKATMQALLNKQKGAGKQVFQISVDNADRKLKETANDLTDHHKTKPVMPTKPVVAAKPLSRTNSAEGKLPTMPAGFSQQYKQTFGTDRLANAGAAATGVNAYGDDAAGMAYLTGGGANPFNWGAAAGPSTSAAGAKHTANLGPTGLPAGGGLYPDIDMGMGDSDDDDIYARRFRYGAGDEYGAGYGGAHTYTEEEAMKFFDDATTGFDFNEEGEAAMEEALTTVGLEATGTKFPNSNIKPMPHQILGIAWMLNQEKVKTKIRGGILADEMGLGKTVQTISLILLNQAKEDDDEKATLVLAPVALLEQWKNEITKFSDGKMSVYIYHNTGKKIGKDELSKYDVVLTTTNTMANEWEECDDTARRRAKGKAKKAGQEWTEEDEAEWYEKASEQMKPLFTINWRRVVIDEAQNIRNRNTKVSRASTYLNANYRWCLTGTPVTNTLTDIYSLLRFLKVKPWHDYTEWMKRVGRIEKKRPDVASQRVQALLKLVLLRRNKDAKLNGTRLIDLPPLHVHETAVFLSEDERNVYDYIEGKSQQQLSKYIREGTVMKNYAHVFVLLLRLRQCVGHPALVTESCLNSALSKEDDSAADRAAAHKSCVTKCGQEKLDAMLKRRYDMAVQRFEDEKAGRDLQMEECPICMDALDASALITACGHAFCGCIKEWMEAPETAAQNPEGFAEHERTCPNCRQKIAKETLFEMKHFEPTKQQIAEITGTEVTNDEAEFEKDMTEYLKKKNSDLINKKRKGKGKATTTRKPRAAKTRAAKKRVIKDSEDEDDFIDDSEAASKVAGYTKKTGAESDSEAEIDEIESESEFEASEAEASDDEDIKDFLRSNKDVKVNEISDDLRDKYKKSAGRQFIPSAKLEAMVKIIREAPKEDKFMIISQWTSMLDLVSAYLDELNINWITFRGDMKRGDRDEAVRRFNESKKVKCLLMSLKAGGVGLNMVGGNRAILLDLAWSPAVEAQAFCRMHRLGQEKEVFVERCVVAGTVEDRILELQEHKKKLADHSLGEGTGEKLKKFGVAELKMLFGMTAERGLLASQWVHPDEKRKERAAAPQAGPSGTNGPAAPSF